MTNNEELYDAILNGRLETAVAVTRQMLAAGADPHGLIDHSMIRAMEEIGARFEAGKAFVPNLLMSARAMKGALELLRPMLKGGNASSSGKVVIGTVKGDLHDIGKNLVASMLEGCGFEVVNLGVDVSSERFIDEGNIGRLYDTLSYVIASMDVSYHNQFTNREYRFLLKEVQDIIQKIHYQINLYYESMKDHSHTR